MELVYAAVAVVLGLVALVFGADRFVLGAASLAARMGVPPLLVGMVVVGLGTSAPEILVSTVAALDGTGGLAVGNALGSNISNVGLVLGVAALISPITVDVSVRRRELPILLGVTALGYVLLQDGHLGRMDGVILACSFVLVLGRMIFSGMRGRASAGPPTSEGIEPSSEGARVESEGGDADEGTTEDDEGRLSVGSAAIWLVVGFALLVLGSRGIVWGATTIAKSFGVSDLVIGLTIVAVGTSLPELAATVVSAFRGEHEMAVGNVIGSNTFNLLAVLPLPGLISPSEIPPEVAGRDYLVMAGMTVLLALATFVPLGNRHLSRVEGFVMLSCFVAYMTWLGVTATG